LIAAWSGNNIATTSFESVFAATRSVADSVVTWSGIGFIGTWSVVDSAATCFVVASVMSWGIGSGATSERESSVGLGHDSNSSDTLPEGMTMSI